MYIPFIFHLSPYLCPAGRPSLQHQARVQLAAVPLLPATAATRHSAASATVWMLLNDETLGKMCKNVGNMWDTSENINHHGTHAEIHGKHVEKHGKHEGKHGFKQETLGNLKDFKQHSVILVGMN